MSNEFGKRKEEIRKLRTLDLVAVLSILGYSSIDKLSTKLDGTSGYRSLRRIGKQLESYKSLSRLGNLSQEEIESRVDETKKRADDNSAYLQSQNEFYYETRGVLPDFCADMDKKLTSEEWKNYASVVRDTARLYLGLNYDILPAGVASRIGKVKDLTKLSDFDVEEEISKLIDDGRFDKACNIEDKFFQSEAERFDDEYNSMGVTDPAIINTSVGVQLTSLLRQVQASRDERQTYMSKYESMQKFIERIYGAKTLKIDQRVPGGIRGER